jgi:hypothetical protein
MFQPYMLYIKLAAAAALLAATSYGTYKVTSNHYIVIAQQKQIDVDKASAKLIAEKDAKIKQGDEQYAKDQATINFLASESGSVQVHIPTPSCRNTQSSPDTSAASGVFSAAVDAAFKRLQDGISKIIQQCDQLNIDARKSNEANK